MNAIFLFAVTVAILVPVGAFAADIYRSRSWNLVFSHFWYFTLIWLVSFPLKAIAINSGFVTSAALRELSVEDLTPAVGLSFLLWLGVYVGCFRSGMRMTAESFNHVARLHGPQATRVALALILSVVVSLPVSVLVYKMNSGASILSGHENPGTGYFSYRLGLGHIFLLAEIVQLTVIAAAIPVLTASLEQRRPRIALIAFGIAILAAVPITMLLASRRMLAACLLSLVIVLALRICKLRWLVLIGVLGTIFGSILLHVVRYAKVPAYASDFHFIGKGQAFFSSIYHLFRDQIADPRGGLLKALFDSFEGIEHVAAMIQKAAWQQLVFGIDHGLSWLYNVGLSLIPRAIWASKPVIYGNNAQQYFLYPEWFRDGLMIVAMPPSFVVDFVFGFGILGAVILAVMLGRVLRISENYLTNPTANLVQRALALFLFINMFNIVRSGTSIVQSLILYGIVVLIIYGWHPTMRGVLDYARTVFYRSRTIP